MKLFGKKQSKLLLVAMCVSVMCATHAFSKPKSESVKEEAGYYYGYGKAATEQDAMAIAKKDLIENALTATLRLKNPKASRVIISDEVANARLSNIKAQYPNSKNKLNLYYRISVRDWERDEKAYDEKLRSSLTTRYNSLSARGSSASKIETAVSILNELAINGKTELLTLQAEGTELFSRKVESICKSIVDGLVFTISTKNGIIRPDTNFSVKVAESSGSPVSNLSVKAVWELPGLSIHREGEEVHEVVSVVKTDAQGNAKIDYPVSDSYKNRIVCLTVSTAFSMSETATTEMRMLDAACSTEGHFVHYEDLETAYKSFVVEAGEYKTGKVVHDRRAVTGKEDERDAKLESFAIDLYPVTNMQYAAYLYTTDSLEEPEYFANSDYNNELQPVVGISASQAEAYAAWLSEQTGWTFRLPTDDEWEIAARAGSEVIYPWGNDDPKKAKAANFKGNGKYKYTSPVGSFESGNNAWGISDMSGNVWEWTSTNRSEDETLRTVKGGSFMDGPTDLRISNYKNIPADVGERDVGFRLVKEVSNED